MSLSDKVSYLRGLMDGLSIDEKKPESKLFFAIIDVIGEISDEIDCVNDDVDELYELCDDIDCDLGEVERELYGEDEDYEGDDDYYEVECPECGERICVDQDLAAEGEVICPVCGENVQFDVGDFGCECGCDECGSPDQQ